MKKMKEKSLIKNALFNVSYKLLSVLFPLITISYASRILGASGIGTISSAQNLVTYFSTIAALGIPSYGVRAISQNRKNENNKNKTFSELFTINFVMSIIDFICYVLFIFGTSQQNMLLSLVFSSIVFLNIFNIEWLYQGMEEYVYIAIRSFIIKIISVVLLFIFVKDIYDIEIYALIICFGTIGNYILNVLNLKKYVKFTLKGLDIKKHIKPILIFFASVIAIELYSLLDITMLTRMATSEAVGYYNNAVKIIKTIANSVTAFGAVLLPRLSMHYADKNISQIKKELTRFLKIITTLTFPAVIGILLTSKEIVLILFGKEFLPATDTLKILAPLIILMPLSGGIFGQLLLTTGKEKKYLVCVCLGAFINCILNYILIKKYLQNGAALASVITEFCVTLLMIKMSRQDVKLDFEIKHYIKVILASFSMFIPCIIISLLNLHIGTIGIFMLKLILSILLYFILLYFFKNEVVIIIMEKVKGKVKCQKK